ncbi:MAG: pyruvate kinase [Chloroflexi bacterium]|nr:pyruvate kinase [Chloroflexota bacterium]
MNHRAKIVATLGPSSDDVAVLKRLIDTGLDVARLNFSHGTHEEHEARIEKIRSLSQKAGKPITILQDLQGPRIRIGILESGSVTLAPGQKVILLSKPFRSKDRLEIHGETIIPMDFPQLPASVKQGARILLDSGQMELTVESVAEDWVEAKVVVGGKLLSHKGVNLPGISLPIDRFTEKDHQDLAFGLSQGVDAVAISFVCTAQDVEHVRQTIQELSPKRANTLLIAKLEKPEALDNLEAILAASDGVMIARGDLGVELSPAEVPIAQKRIIHAANRANKYVITATQMLESMVENPRPTRAEASDVANAIFDGTDAVMLSEETAAGKYPIESVAMMGKIIEQAEAHYGEWGTLGLEQEETSDDALAITCGARELAHDRNVTAIAVFTQTGRTALLMSKSRPKVPILAFTPEEETYYQLQGYWGVTPQMVPFASTMEEMIDHVEKAMLTSSLLHSGEQVVLISGFPVGAYHPANFALLHTIGEKAQVSTSER